MRTKWSVHERNMETVNNQKCVQYYDLDMWKWCKRGSLVENKVEAGCVVLSWFYNPWKAIVEKETVKWEKTPAHFLHLV